MVWLRNGGDWRPGITLILMGVVYLVDFRVNVFISDWWYRAGMRGDVAKVLRRLRWDCFEGRGR